MKADGSHVEQITRNRGDDWAATWSPDARWIAFTRARYRRSREGLALLNVRDRDVAHLGTRQPFALEPSWQPL
jgi:Tol biopolymer transport system component